jgi:hypothetical protein
MLKLKIFLKKGIALSTKPPKRYLLSMKAYQQVIFVTHTAYIVQRQEKLFCNLF